MALINPVVLTLPPVTFPVALTKPAVSTLPPVMLAALVMVEVAEIKPPVSTLPPVMLAAATMLPAILNPNGVKLNRLNWPATLPMMFPSDIGMFIAVIPLAIC